MGWRGCWSGLGQGGAFGCVQRVRSACMSQSPKPGGYCRGQTRSNGMGKILLWLSVLPVVILIGFVILFVAVVSMIGQSLDQTIGFGGQQVLAWMQDTPQPTGADYYGTPGAVGAAGPVFSGGQVKFAGYDGPLSFLCILPILHGVLTDVYGAIRTPYPAHSGIDYGTCYRQNVSV